MPEAFLPLTDFVNEAKSIPKDHSLDQPVAKWVEDEILGDEIVEAGVAILRTRGCYWSIKAVSYTHLTLPTNREV